MLGGTYTTTQADDLEGLTQIKSLSELTDGSYYYIVEDKSTFYNSHGKSVAFYYDSSNPGNLYWNQLNTSETNYAFKITSAGTDNSYYICSYSGFYPSSGGSSLVSLTTTPTPVTITENATSTDNGNGVAGTFLITASYTGNNRYYTDDSGYGENTKNQVGYNNWSVDINPNSLLCTYSYWRIYKITDELQAEIDKTDAETLAKQTAIATLKSDLAKYKGTENYVFGITADNYSAAENAINALSAEKSTLDEINAVKIEDYVTKLTTGYYRLQNYYWGNQDRTHSILRVDAQRSMYADMPQDGDETKKDLSTVFYINVPSGQETSLAPTGLTVRSQNRSLIYNSNKTYNADDQVIDASEGNAYSVNLAIPKSDRLNNADRGIQVTNGSGGATYLYKKGDGATPPRYIAGWKDGIAETSHWNIIPATDITVNMNSVEGDANTYATLYAPFAITLQEGLTAYTGTLNTDNTKLTLSPIEGSVVPAATPVVLIGSKKSYTLDIAADNTSDPISSAFTGQYLADINEDTGVYTLGAKNNVVGFYPYKDAIKANKARLILGSSKDSKGFAFSFGDDDPTGINTATAKGAALKVGDVIYDLQGRKVKDARRGIYIINGKKTVVK